MGQNHKNKIKTLAAEAHRHYGHLVLEAQVNFVLVRYSEASPKEARRAVLAVIRRKKSESGDTAAIRTLANR